MTLTLPSINLFLSLLIISSPLIFASEQNTTISPSTKFIDYRDEPHLSFQAIFNDFYPKLMKVFYCEYLNITEDHQQDRYMDWLGLQKTRRPRFIRIKIVSHKFNTVPTEDRHAMVHEALKEEMTKREAGCAIDIHADTPEEWNQFKANNDFDENKGQVDLRVRSKKRSTVISPQDAELRVKIYKYLKMHFDPLHLHVVDSKDQHPVDNDNPAFDVLIVSNKFNNLTITQRTVLVHDYLRDYINEGIQFRLHSLQSPEEVYPDRFNIDGFETAAFVQVLDIHKYINPYRIYEPPPKHVVHLNNLLINNQSVIADAKKKLREWDQKRLKEKEAG